MAQATSFAVRWAGLLKRRLRTASDCLPPEMRRRAYRNRRAEPRLNVPFEVKIAGESCPRWARGVNLTAGGALMLVARPLAPESVVFVHVRNFGLMGFARVRHCTARGVNNYAVGVEFPSPLMMDEIGTWQFHRVRQTDSGWSMELATSINLGTAVRAA